MATTRIMPLHVGKGRTESRAISDIIDYVANPQKTDNGKLIASYSSLSTRPFETAALIFRAAVSLRLHKPMTTCRDTVADWRLIYRVPFAFSKLT